MAQNERRQSTAVGSTEKKLSGIYDGEYFEILHRQEDTLFVKCNTCGPEGLQLRASARSNGNILKHVKRRHPELLAKIREEKHIKTRGSIGQNQNLYASAEKKPKSQMVFKVKQEEIVFVEQNNDSECMNSSYITTSAPDDKSPFAANVMVHLEPQPIHPNIIDHQQHHVITSQHNLGEGDHHMMSSSHPVRNDQQDEEEEEEEEEEGHQLPEEEGQQDCENVEYLSSNMHHDTGLIDLNSVEHDQTSRNDIRQRSIVVSTSGPVVGHTSATLGNRTGLTIKRRLEIPRVDDEDEEENNYNQSDPLGANDELTAGHSFFGAQASKFPSVNRTVDHYKEIVMLRKKLMIREFEMVQQKHQLEIELLQKELEFKKAQHQKIIECLNKKLYKK